MCFLHVGVAALWMSFSVGGKRQDPSIILVGQREVFILPWLEVCWCVLQGASQGNIEVLQPDAGFKALSSISASDTTVP